MGERLTRIAPELPNENQSFVEMALVLPQWQVDALTNAARGCGMTAGQILRRLIRHYCQSVASADC